MRDSKWSMSQLSEHLVVASRWRYGIPPTSWVASTIVHEHLMRRRIFGARRYNCFPALSFDCHIYFLACFEVNNVIIFGSGFIFIYNPHRTIPLNTKYYLKGEQLQMTCTSLFKKRRREDQYISWRNFS